MCLYYWIYSSRDNSIVLLQFHYIIVMGIHQNVNSMGWHVVMGHQVTVELVGSHSVCEAELRNQCVCLSVCLSVCQPACLSVHPTNIEKSWKTGSLDSSNLWLSHKSVHKTTCIVQFWQFLTIKSPIPRSQNSCLRMRPRVNHGHVYPMYTMHYYFDDWVECSTGHLQLFQKYWLDVWTPLMKSVIPCQRNNTPT